MTPAYLAEIERIKILFGLWLNHKHPKPSPTQADATAHAIEMGDRSI